ncbi:MAG: DNA helicase UvrD [Candidatus Kerfeldbacteria bacterium CG08_land_8_20_14_0_20_43_14]|uniref:DNA helicase UvrD n=1 Tax=Candidatus Kerfeldbacteria bacterium CG08_land_8_20_14_0_20_43_14 TaxID=2014246 RepID=A0A2H0YQQ5_9BACT|nr:MAG: DNA helicase UvrD [Candidatus Kerfeldbacteria bacterium CG08_land_8_20_14_0_20_43_14]
MKLIADLHVHSRFSRAVSRDMTLPNMHEWASYKGIGLVGTGDFTHPTWFSEMRERLRPTADGLLELKPSFRSKSAIANPLFIPTTELSCIYTEFEKTRRIHLVILAPDLSTVEKINKELDKDFNLKSDGRPILGISAHDLTEKLLKVDKSLIIIPAHVWTPWFSIFGSASGYDSAKECFRDLLDKIPAIETGLSSDPAMNWRLSQLDKFNIVSAGDSHSPRKLGREATVFELEKFGFKELTQALWFNPLANDKKSQNYILETLEFFPEEGKYHLDGHAKCQQRLTPAQTKKLGGVCPVCKKPITVGVLSRVEKLADRPEGYKNSARPAYRTLVPLEEAIGEALDVGPGSKSVQQIWTLLIKELQGEFNVLLETPIAEIKTLSQEIVAEAVSRVRSGKLIIEGGYDGIFGTVKIFNNKERKKLEQTSLF